MNTTLKTYRILVAALTCAALSTFAQESLDRSVRPQSQPVPKVRLPEFQKATLSNGLNIWMVEDHSLPLAAMNLVIQAGSDHDPLDKPGIASMAAEVLDEGTTTRNALQISDELDFIGANMNVRSTFDGTFLSLNTLTKHMDKALDVYLDVLTNATFPEKEFVRLKEQRLTSLLQQKDRPGTIANLSFNYIIYGVQHPYGNDPSGSEQSISSMTRDDLVSFYQTYYRPNNATLIVVGDVTLKDIATRLERGLASWKSTTIPAFQHRPASSVEKRSVYLIDKPGAAQSEIRIGYPAVARNSPDFFPITIMNRVLGGQFTSRLNLNLREKRGFSYGVRSAFQFNKYPGPFVASGGVTTAKTDSSLQEFMYEIGKMYREGVTADELQFVKKSLTGSFALGFETPAQIAGAIQNVVLYSLPENYYQTYLENIERVALDQVQRVATKYLDTSKMAVVIVGDLKVIKDGIEKLQLGETVLCDVNGHKLTQ